MFDWEGPNHDNIKNRFIGDFRGWEDDARFAKALGELVEALNENRIKVIPRSKYTKP